MHPANIGSFQILRELGRGGMGEVYLALDTRLDQLRGCPTFDVGQGEDAATVTVTMLPAPPVDADDAYAVEQTVTSPESDATTLTFAAQVGDTFGCAPDPRTESASPPSATRLRMNRRAASCHGLRPATSSAVSPGASSNAGSRSTAYSVRTPLVSSGARILVRYCTDACARRKYHCGLNW